MYTINTVKEIIIQTWHLTLEMTPYLLLGLLAAGILHVFVSVDKISRHLGKDSLLSILKASLLGIPIPLCSCSVLPVATSIRKAGASKSATLSFLITTPVTGVDSLMATWALLGLVFTLVRLAASFIIGFLTGIILNIFSNNDHNNSGADTSSGENCSTCCTNKSCCKIEPARYGKNLHKKIKDVLYYSFIDLPSSLSGSLLFGLLLGGAISVLVPAGLIQQYTGQGIAGIVLAVIIAIPLYVCATASIPIAVGLVVSGFTPGAALAFILAGPATNTVAIAATRKILGNRAMLVYLIMIFLGAIGSGLLLDLFNINLPVAALKPHADGIGIYLKLISGISLTGLLIVLFIKEKFLRIRKKLSI